MSIFRIPKSQLTKQLLARLALLVWLLAFGTMTTVLAADNTLYGVTNNAPFTIYTIDTSTGLATPVGTLAFSTAAIARSPTTGLIYYTDLNPTAGLYNIATWNPATSANTILSGTINVYLPRLAFRSDGTLYGMDSNNNLYTLSTATGAILTTTPISGGGLGLGLGGDIAFAPDGTLYLVAGTNLYRITGSTSTLVGATGTPTLAGLSFATDGSLYASDTGGATSLIYRLSTSGGVTATVGNSGAALADLAGMPAFANLSIAKTATSAFNVGQPATYSLSVANGGPQSASGLITVKDTLPGGLTYVSAIGTGWTCGVAGGVVTCTTPGPVANGVTLPAIVVTVTVGAGALPSVTNTATVSSTTFDQAPANNSSTITTTVNPVVDLQIAKTHAGNFTVGVNGTYTLTASNSGTLATSGTITVTDNLPTGLTVASTPTGTGWNCGTTVVGSSTATCTSVTVIAAGATSPNPITVTVVVAAAAFPAVTNAATISGGGEPAFNNGNNSASDPTTINGVADVRIAKTHAGNFTVGVNGTYTLTASNSGTLATSGTITVVDNLPAGLTIAALPTGTGWNCSTTVVGSSTATCTSATVIAAGATSPNPITVTVVVAAAAFPSVTNAATISGGGEPAYNNGNNSVTDPTTVNGVADLRIAKSHAGNFTVGVNGTYTLTASNSGTLATSGTITVVDNLPAGLTIAAIPTGTGWNCATTVVGSSTATCTSATVIAAGATSPNPITVTVVVAPAAFPSVTNAATISGGGEPAYNNGNNSVTDPTTVNGVADVRLAKSHAGNFTVGVNGTYTLTASNSGTLATSGTITVTDNLPTGLTVASTPTGTGWNCGTTVVGSSTATCTSVTVIAAGATSPNPITVTVVVAAAAFPSVTNAATISGGGEPAFNNGNNSASDPTTINGVADVRIAKTHAGNFTVGVNGTYTLTASNSGTLATSGTITVVDNLPAGLTIAALPTGTGWNCSTTVVGSSTATCTSATVIAAGATSPNPITVTVVVAAAAFPSVTNAATISGGGEPAYNNGNNSVTDPTTVNGVADLLIAKSHAGNFTVGVNGTYTLTASNSGTLATSGTITVIDNLPAGLTIAALPTGTGWNCSTTVVGSSTATCTSATVIAAGATSPNPITVTVVVAAAAFPAVTNAATISGGGEPAYNNGNNSVNDPTTINGVADLTIAKSHAGNFTVGVNGTYTLTASNSGTLATSGTITVIDNLPAGLTIAALPTGTGWNCSTTVVGSSTATCTSATVIAAGATSPNPITLTVVVSPAAFAASPVTNVANISGGGEPAYNNGNNSASDPTTINGVSDLPSPRLTPATSLSESTAPTP